MLNKFNSWDKTDNAHWKEWKDEAKVNYDMVAGRQLPEDAKAANEEAGLVSITINKIDTMGGVPMGDERTNEVWLDNVFVPDEYVVGEVNSGFQYISQALDLERFTMFTYSPIKQRLDLLCDHVATEEIDGEPLRLTHIFDDIDAVDEMEFDEDNLPDEPFDLVRQVDKYFARDELGRRNILVPEIGEILRQEGRR